MKNSNDQILASFDENQEGQQENLAPQFAQPDMVCFERPRIPSSFSAKKVIYDFKTNLTYSEYCYSKKLFYQQLTFRLPYPFTAKNIKSVQLYFSQDIPEHDQKVKATWGKKTYYGQKVQDWLQKNYSQQVNKFPICSLKELWRIKSDDIYSVLNVKDKSIWATFIAKIHVAFTAVDVAGLGSFVQLLLEGYWEVWGSKLGGEIHIPVGNGLIVELF